MMDAMTEEMLKEAKDSFIEGNYKIAEPLLQQLILRNHRNPEIFQMLGTIFYDKGQFNKAIKTFQRALEVDPNYTDAAVGLSIILNDIGRYEEAKQVFHDARSRLDGASGKRDPLVDEKLAIKHEELGDLYFQYKRFKEALEQFYKAKALSTRTVELISRVADCLLKLEEVDKAIRELRSAVKEFPKNISIRMKLAITLYNTQRIAEAIDNWETVLAYDPHHAEAQRNLRMAQSAGVTSLDL